jgi:lysyl-tRNA synthetase class II
LTIDAQGNYTMQVILLQSMPGSLGGRPTAATEDLAKIRFESYAHFGQLRVDESRLHMHVNRASVSTWNGTDLDTPFTISDGSLAFTMGFPSDGNSKGLTVEVAWMHNVAKTVAELDEITRDCMNRTRQIHERYAVGESRIDK